MTHDTREAFEAWCGKNLYSTMKVLGGECPDGLPVYASTATHAAWWAWQAATAQQAADHAQVLEQNTALDAACAALEAQVAQQAAEVQQLTEYADALNARCVADAADAERYRWLREHTAATCLSSWLHACGTQFLDEAVDSARAARQDGAGEQG